VIFPVDKSILSAAIVEPYLLDLPFILLGVSIHILFLTAVIPLLLGFAIVGTLVIPLLVCFFIGHKFIWIIETFYGRVSNFQS